MLSSSSVEGMNEAVDEASVSIEYYTDPLCSWSWAFEAHWRRLRFEYAGRIKWHYRIGGLLPDWRSYNDPLNSISNPAQMGPQWFQVQEVTGMPLDASIWHSNPPGSSYPACVAVKAAERQGAAVGEYYLRCLREAVMLERRNIAHQEVLLAVAREVATASPMKDRFDLDRFQADLTAPETMEAFRQDLRDVAYYGFGRFPTLVLQRPDGRGIVLVGYRPYEPLQAALQHLVPDIQQREDLQKMTPEERIVSYIKQWQRTTGHELAEGLGYTMEQVSEVLRDLTTDGKVLQAEKLDGVTPIYTLVLGKDV